MSWDSPTEKLLYTRAWELLRASGNRPFDYSGDTTIELELTNVGGMDLSIVGGDDRPFELDIWIENDQTWGSIHVLCKDENGVNTQCVYQEVEDPVFPAYQPAVLEALKMYSVLDEIARAAEPTPGSQPRDE